MKSSLLSLVSTCVGSAIFCSAASAALLPRLETAPGSGVFLAYHDEQLDITWAADAHVNGARPWVAQTCWATTLTLRGIGGWRLPYMVQDRVRDHPQWQVVLRIRPGIGLRESGNSTISEFS